MAYIVRASPRDSISLLNAGIEILVKIYPPTASLNDYPNIAIFYSGLFASQK
jgi:hypothetical protein